MQLPRCLHRHRRSVRSEWAAGGLLERSCKRAPREMAERLGWSAVHAPVNRTADTAKADKTRLISTPARHSPAQHGGAVTFLEIPQSQPHASCHPSNNPSSPLCKGPQPMHGKKRLISASILVLLGLPLAVVGTAKGLMPLVNMYAEALDDPMGKKSPTAQAPSSSQPSSLDDPRAARNQMFVGVGIGVVGALATSAGLTLGMSGIIALARSRRKR
jgi:hypothetical protein